jgi:tRNA G18 (ribose-2'-O)-methylase SpoU
MRVERIASLGDPRVADYRDLKESALRADADLFIAESRLGVRRLLASHRFRVRSLFLTEAALRGLWDALEELGDDTPVYLATREVLSGVVGYNMHRGCIAAGERGEPTSLDEILVDCESGPRLLVALEDVTNPENVGGVFRNAAAFGADAVLLTRRCSDPLYRKAIRVSMGATLRTPFARVEDWPKSLRRLREAGFAVAALTLSGGALAISEFGRGRALPRRLALVLGTEGEGLSEAALAAADLEVTIPMAPGVDSLNVATASGIALHHFAASRGGRAAPG